MDIAEQNAIKDVARQCWRDVQAAYKNLNPKTSLEKMAIYMPILADYEKKISPLYTRSQLIYWIGRANGRLKEHW